MRGQRGFSLLEVLIASAIAVVLACQSIAAIHAFALEAASTGRRVRAASAWAGLRERLAGSAATAWSVFVPQRDVLGNANADGHEVDFVTQDATRRSFWWAYAFDRSKRRITQYAYSPGGDMRAGATYDDIDGFAAIAYPISAVALPSSPAYDALFAGATAPDVTVPFAWTPAAAGGNGIVRATIDAPGVHALEILAPATAPTRFTVVLTYTPAPPGL
ncbi:MAG TPA: prepilin-type N-terminal cleavage/methylation domain-containing protein [Candidatus Tumulicola sp.]